MRYDKRQTLGAAYPRSETHTQARSYCAWRAALRSIFARAERRAYVRGQKRDAKSAGRDKFHRGYGRDRKDRSAHLPQETVTDSAACALAMLRRSHKNDASEIIRLLKMGSYSALIGAVTALTGDQMIPCESEILEILKLTKDANKHKGRQGSEFGRRVRGPT